MFCLLWSPWGQKRCLRLARQRGWSFRPLSAPPVARAHSPELYTLYILKGLVRRKSLITEHHLVPSPPTEFQQGVVTTTNDGFLINKDFEPHTVWGNVSKQGHMCSHHPDSLRTLRGTGAWLQSSHVIYLQDTRHQTQDWTGL